jgi:hypothetical protein
VSSSPNDGKGAAQLDVVAGSMGQVFDLTGNVSEWASDLIPAIRGTGVGYPWFCMGALPPRSGPTDVPRCPTGAVCVRGQYQPEGLPLGDYPVCIAWGRELEAISGAHGSLMGGNFSDNDIDRSHAGVFARRLELNPDKEPAKEYGFRCVGDIAVEDDRLEASNVTQ